MYRQFAYILAPARSWAGFGGLDVTVHVPDDWSVASRPALQREGALLNGSFNDVPADAIALTLRPPVGTGYRIVKHSAWGFFVVVGIGGLVCCWRWRGRREPRNLQPESADRQRSGIRNFVRSVVIGLTFGALLFVTGLAAAWGVDSLFPPTTGELALVNELGLSDGYASLVAGVGILFLSVLAAGVGFVIALIPRRPEAC
jgi:uncharacterized iron-regulated membrane protein